MNVVVTGIGYNIASMRFALARLGVDAVFTNDPEIIKRATRVILPGVGTAGGAMKNLRNAALVDVLRQLTVPVLGICVGMQILLAYSEEDEATTLGIIPGQVQRLQPSEGITIPHMGWNCLEIIAKDNPLLTGIDDGSYVYFVHSYAVLNSEYALAQCRHGQTVSAVIGKDNFYGVQFHPERSATIGAKLLKNFFTL